MGVVKYTGSVTSFHCPTNAEIRSLKVHFSPKQEGTGDPSPENVRPIVGWDRVKTKQTTENLWGGSAMRESIENVFPIISTNNNTITYSNSGAPQADGSVLFSSFKPNTQYTLILTYSKSTNVYTHIAFLYTDGSYTMHSRVAPESPSVKTTEVYVSKANKSLAAIIRKADEYSNVNLYCDESGLFEGIISANEFKPYQDITTNYEFGALGKNKFPSATGSLSNCLLRANVTYTLSATSTSAGYFKGWYEDETDTGIIWIRDDAGENRRSLTLTPERDIVKGTFFVAQGMSECQIELGDTVTAYEPYNSNHTVYGGWVDLISGEVCETDHCLLVDGTNIKCNRDYSDGTYIAAGIVYLIPDGTNDPHYRRLGLHTLCDNIPMYGGADDYPDILPFAKSTNAGSQFIRFYIALASEHVELDTAQKKIDYINAYLAEHPATIVYRLSSPIYYYISPTQLSTFLGQNNIWSNADYVEVEYDLHETQSILARKQFIIANQPHIETTSGAIATFNTDMTAPLKECKIYFNPIQEGSGTPTLDNIRPIRGYNNINVGVNHAPLPVEYQEIEYVQNTSVDSYFITDYYPNNQTDFYADFSFSYNDDTEYPSTLFSAGDTYRFYKSGYYVWSYTKGNQTTRTSGYNVYRGHIQAKTNTTHLTIIDPNQTRNYSIQNGGTFQSTTPLILFATNSNGIIKGRYRDADVSRLYRLILYENNQVVHNYIPCYRKSDNEVGLFDLITNTFLTHSGEGTFSAGPNITTDTTIAIDWEDDYGTIYGGYIDLINGELVQEYYKTTLDGISDNCKANRDYSNNSYIIGGVVWLNPYGAADKTGGVSRLYCDKMQMLTINSSSQTLPYIKTVGNGHQYLLIYLANAEYYPDLDTEQKRIDFVNAYLQENPLTIIYPLTEPIHYQLSSQTLKSLRGQNNIWSNANDLIEIKYWTH